MVFNKSVYIDELFSDCDKIAQENELKLLDVVFIYNKLELKYLRQKIYIPYPDLMNELKAYIRDNKDEVKRDV